MKKAVVVAMVASLIVLAVNGEAAAQRRRGGRNRRPAAPAAPQEAPMSEAISPAMGELRWGMSRADVLGFFRRQIQEAYRPRLAKATGAIEEDRLRAEMGDELRRLTESEVCFRGNRTGWDASFIRDEFTHNNNECLLVKNDGNSQNFYFFINSKLWKWYKAFNAEVFQGQDFAQFSQALQSRYGNARQANGELVTGSGARQWLEWQDTATRLRAIDQTRFYGFFCLVFEEKETLGNLATLRRNAPAARNNRHALVDAVTSGEGEHANPDGNTDIVDRITGNIRNRQDAPAPAANGRNGARPAGTPPAAAPARPSSQSADPLGSMDL
jgi:hypothetical protein